MFFHTHGCAGRRLGDFGKGNDERGWKDAGGVGEESGGAGGVGEESLCGTRLDRSFPGFLPPSPRLPPPHTSLPPPLPLSISRRYLERLDDFSQKLRALFPLPDLRTRKIIDTYEPTPQVCNDQGRL